MSAKCACKVTEEGFQRAWNNVCKTRELCDEAILGRYLSIVRFRFSFILQITSESCKVNVLELLTGVQNVAFFFSAISAQGPPKSKGKKQAGAPEPEGDDSNDEVLTSQVASNTSPEWLSHHATVVDEKLRLTINYWIALTTPNGAPANPIFIHRALLDCDVETVANQVHYL